MDLLIALLFAPLPVVIGLALFACLALVGAYRIVFDGLRWWRYTSARREMRNVVAHRLRDIQNREVSRRYR